MRPYPSPVLTRRATVTDLAILVELCAEHAVFERTQLNREGMQERLEQAIFEHPARLHCWVAECSGVTVGYATATVDFSTWDAMPFTHLDCLYLQASARGKGLGRLLLGEVIEFAKTLNCRKLQWQTPVWNQPAIRFYEREGAVAHQKCRIKNVVSS